MPDTILVALGGNALIKAGQRGLIEEQEANLRESLAVVVELVRRGYHVVLTHGNGPQVGHILIRVEEAGEKAYRLPLDVCVAQSQGEIGYLIQQILQNLLRQSEMNHRTVATVLSRTVVDQHDPRMTSPTKPIGPFYAEWQAARLREQGVPLVEDAHRGYRRVVPSPLPIRVVETDVIQRLVREGVIVIAVGGGGIPVNIAEDGTLVGIEAVVDKDLASSVLAVALGAQKILDLTAVDHVKLWFGTPEECNLDALTTAEARTYLAQGHFAPGSMAPKIEAAIHFLEHGGREVVITRPELALEAFNGRGGTHLYSDQQREHEPVLPG